MTLKRLPPEYVSVPRAVCPNWWPRPYSELRAAAQQGRDGLALHVTPKKTFTTAIGDTREIDDYPFRVSGAMTFYEGDHRDGFSRDDVAALHSQGW